MNKEIRALSEVESYLPHNFLAEKTILSCMIIDSEVIDTIYKNIRVETFYFKNHQELFKAIVTMYEEQKLVDIITLTTFLQENGLIKKVGGIKVLIELNNQIPNLVHLNEYLKLIRDKFLRRSLIRLGYKLVNSSYISNIPLENILTEFEYEVFHLTNNFKNKKLFSCTDLVYNVFIELKNNYV